MLIFSNPGEIDPRLITTFGANVKVGESPIGHFGTGLKYAIAVILRNGGSISIHSGSSHYKFGLKPDTIRGKEFQFVTMNGQPVGFTTELGKGWEPWMAYRELWSNAKDEGGRVVALSNATLRRRVYPNETSIAVEGLDEVHANRSAYFLDETLIPIVSDPYCDIYPGSSSAIFYHGIKVATLAERSLYTYNLKTAALTEDRTLLTIESAKDTIVRAVCRSKDSYLIESVIRAKAHFEMDLPWYGAAWANRSEIFDKKIIALGRNKSVELPGALASIFRSLAPEDSMPHPVVPTVLESKALIHAAAILERLGWTVANEIVVVESLGEKGESSTTLGLAFQSKIWISRAAFRKGLHAVIQVLLEEHIHLQMGYDDCSRNLQNYLFETIVRLGGEALGEIL